ncbi:MAG: dihydropteroate synthase, partial [Phycisphaerae bacterium]
MAIVNVTPDSFSDGGRFASVEAAVDACVGFVASGAAMLDIGGESTRPGAERVAPVEQVERVVPVIEASRRDARFASVP